MMRLSDIARRANGELYGTDQDVLGVSIDTRTLSKGEVFVALKGPNFDGHSYLDVAEGKGASASIVQNKNLKSVLSSVVVEDTYDALKKMAELRRKEFKGKIAAITGSCGKTTVKGMLEKICETAGGCIATKGNLNNLIGVPLSLLRLGNHVPYGVIEAGTSVPGEIPELAKIISADVALVNNVMPTHVEGFGSVAKIAEEKCSLYESLSPDGVAVVNLDDPQTNYFLEQCQHTKKIGFSSKAENQMKPEFESVFYAREIQLINGVLPKFKLVVGSQSFDCELAVPGEHNVMNALAAAATAAALGIELEKILEGLKAFQGVPRRMQVKRHYLGGVLIDDTYNASPGSVKAAIKVLKNYGNSFLVLGDMGELGVEASKQHKQIGAYAKASGIQSVFCTGILAAETVNEFGVGATWCETQSELLNRLNERLQKDSAVLVKGSRFMKMDLIADALSEKEGK